VSCAHVFEYAKQNFKMAVSVSPDLFFYLFVNRLLTSHLGQATNKKKM
jgi:hypothetical protein